MNVVVQNLESKLYATSDGSWHKLNDHTARFENAVEAISFCIRHGWRSVRLVSNVRSKGEERYVYPFGEDPAIKAEKKKLRRFMAESRRLKQQKRILMQRLDMLQAESKERKKQVPFKRKPLS